MFVTWILNINPAQNRIKVMHCGRYVRIIIFLRTAGMSSPTASSLCYSLIGRVFEINETIFQCFGHVVSLKGGCMNLVTSLCHNSVF